MNLRKTKIIATLGPALKINDNLSKIIDLGVDVLRFNFSHLTPDQAQKDYLWVQKVTKQKKKNLTFLADLKGPEIRLGDCEFDLKNHEIVGFKYHIPSTSVKTILENSTNNNAKKIIFIDHPFLDKIISPNQIMEIDDGNIKLKTINIEDGLINCKVIVGGLLKKHKSLNISKFNFQLPILSSVDKKNLKFIVEKKFSWIAASFVGSVEDVQNIKKEIKKLGGDIPIISKIESYHGVKNINDIIDISEGIMVARGDLGQEYSYEEIPHLQDLIVEKTKNKGKVCIIATQLLNGMNDSPMPTRSEVTDISIAVKDRVDAVMLSSETAIGKYPVKAVEVIDRVIRKTEIENFAHAKIKLVEYDQNDGFFYPLYRSALTLTRHSNSKCLLIISKRGTSAVYISAFRSTKPTFVITQHMHLFLRSRLYYSVHPVLLKFKGDKIKYLNKCVDWLNTNKILCRKDTVISVYSETDSNNHIIDHITQQLVK